MEAFNVLTWKFRNVIWKYSKFLNRIIHSLKMEIVSFHFCPLRAVEIFNVTVFTRVETEYLLSWNEIFF